MKLSPRSVCVGLIHWLRWIEVDGGANETMIGKAGVDDLHIQLTTIRSRYHHIQRSIIIVCSTGHPLRGTNIRQ